MVYFALFVIQKTATDCNRIKLSGNSGFLNVVEFHHGYSFDLLLPF